MSESEKTAEKTPVTTSPSSALGTPLAIVLAGVIIAGAIMFSGGGTPTVVDDHVDQPEQKSNKELLKLSAIQEDDHIRGNAEADVYILEFSDTECPFCKNFHETMKQVQNEYGEKVAWVYRHFPLAQLHPTAPRESEALECANELGGSDIFWAYTDTVYERTPQGAALTDGDLFNFAEELGLNRAAFTECLNSGKYTDEVQKDLQNAVDLGGRGTPHSLIIAGDEIIPINGAQPYSVVKASLDAALNN